MRHFSCYLPVFLIAIGAGQSVHALPRVESRVIPTQATASSQPERLQYAESAQPALSEALLDQISVLQREVQELRGLLETQEHELKRVEKSQQTLFLNLEKQLTDNTQKKGTTAALSNVMSSLKPATNTTPEPATLAKKEELTEKIPRTETDVTLIKTAEGFLKEKKYIEAEKNYQAYIEAHPTGEFAPSVYYTLGEIYWTEWHTEKSNTLLLEKAVHAFSDVANGFPHHNKAKDALLKIGLVEIEKGNYQTAAQYFKRVIDQYPQSPSAKIAELRLQKLIQDGRIS
jgi:tol-pal system protein YbgF